MKSPFAFEWEKLVADYQDRDEDEEGFFVLRDRQMLKRLQLWFRNDSSINIDGEIFKNLFHFKKSKFQSVFHFFKELITSSPSALVPVSLKMMHRGSRHLTQGPSDREGRVEAAKNSNSENFIPCQSLLNFRQKFPALPIGSTHIN